MSDVSFRSAPGPLAVKAGDRVAYTKYFLRCIMSPATDPAWRRKGIVVDVDGDFACIKWDDIEDLKLVRTSNLAHVGANLRYCE